MQRVLGLIGLVWVVVILGALPPTHTQAVRARALAAQAGPAPITAVDELGGWIYGSVAEGQQAYLIQGAALIVLDISDPDAPRVASRTLLTFQPDQIAAAGGFVYLTQSSASTLWVFDARDPARPLQLGPRPLAVVPLRLSVQAGRLWVSGPTLLAMLDLQSPDAPALLSTFPGRFENIQTVGALVYLLDRDKGLQIWDASDPRAPALRGQVDPLSPGLYLGLALDGQRLYIAARNINISPSTFVLTLDLHDPLKPTLIATAVADAGALGLSEGRLVTLFEQRLLVYDMANPDLPVLMSSRALNVERFQALAGRVYSSLGFVWQILDISNPAAPAPRGRYPAGDVPAAFERLVSVGPRLYASVPFGVQIIDISSPLSPTLQARIPTDEYLPGYDVEGARVLLPSRAGLQLVDASDPLSPTVRAVFPRSRVGKLAGDLLYLLRGDGLQLFDIRDPASPQPLGGVALSIPSDWFDSRVLVGAGRAYAVTTYEASCGRDCTKARLDVWALDVSDPLRPRVGGHFAQDIPTLGADAALSGTTLLIAAFQLLVLDASDAAAPTLRELAYGGRPNTVRVEGARAYLTDGLGLATLDLADPARPALLSRFRLGSWSAHAARVAGARAFVSSDGLRLLDIRSPSSPLPLASYPLGGEDVVAVGDYAFLALGSSGLRVLRIAPERFPAPLLLPLVRRGA